MGNGLRTIQARHVDALAVGAAILGSGGGGDVGLGVHLLRRQLDLGARVRVIDVESLQASRVVIHAAVVGEPDILSERLIDPADFATAVRLLAAHLDVEVSAVGVGEIGGINAMVGVLTALSMGLPVIDGDLTGRAVPRIEQTTLAHAGVPRGPIALVGAHGETAVVSASRPESDSRLLMAAVAGMGGVAAQAIYPVTAGCLAEHGIRGSLTACQQLGREFLKARSGRARDIASSIGGRLLCMGRVDEVFSGPEEIGSVTIDDRHSGAVARLDHRGEFVNVAIDGVSVACAPEVIIAVDMTRRRPLRCDEVKTGQSLAVIGLPALFPWPSDALALVGPASYGVDVGVLERTEV